MRSNKILPQLSSLIIAISRKFFIALIYFYRIVISPIFPIKCRFVPSCSEYALTAYAQHSLKKATCLTVKRIASCHPFGRSGYDPVPGGEKGKD